MATVYIAETERRSSSRAVKPGWDHDSRWAGGGRPARWGLALSTQLSFPHRFLRSARARSIWVPQILAANTLPPPSRRMENITTVAGGGQSADWPMAMAAPALAARLLISAGRRHGNERATARGKIYLNRAADGEIRRIGVDGIIHHGVAGNGQRRGL